MRKEEKAKEGGKTSGAADAEVALNGEVLNRALRDVSRTVDGSGYAFTRLICCGKGVTSLPDALQHYVHLRYIDISDTLTSLYLSHTRIQQLLPLEKFPQIKTLDLEGCALPSEQLKVLVSLPMLKEVCLSPLGTSAGDDQFRSEILKVLPRLQWINGREVTSDELTAATTPCETNVQEEMGLDQP
ncbi:hypothetical protein cyc_04511 [Cyclospora cayetanensis]|uniref:Leucine rich repeat-containing protein n=1 Tax=Cyclospora cayetanensis TaxID=88456 RepID=A0A1D3D2Q7_9EIME|nr:hypothetical protein cyc_04511 [Cyclospora cayetanensis]